MGLRKQRIALKAIGTVAVSEDGTLDLGVGGTYLWRGPLWIRLAVGQGAIRERRALKMSRWPRET